MTGFKDIYFGEVSGEMEGSDHPELLLDGYLDVHKITEIALENQKFLFLGYKGSGKSSLAERVRLISENSYDQFAGIINLEDFPYARLNRVIKGNDEPEVKLPIAWSLLIGIKLLDLIYSDESINNKEEILLLLNILDQSGISGAVDVKEIVRRATKKSFKLQIPKVVEGSWSKEKIELLDDVPSFIELMKAEILKARPINKYYLFIDGLDEILTQRQDQYRALGSLVFEVSRLNKYFKDNNLKIKINVLCRTDLFERIRGANKNKIRQAQSFTFDWFVSYSQKWCFDLRIKRRPGRCQLPQHRL